MAALRTAAARAEELLTPHSPHRAGTETPSQSVQPVPDGSQEAPLGRCRTDRHGLEVGSDPEGGRASPATKGHESAAVSPLRPVRAGGNWPVRRGSNGARDSSVVQDHTPPACNPRLGRRPPRPTPASPPRPTTTASPCLARSGRRLRHPPLHAGIGPRRREPSRRARAYRR